MSHLFVENVNSFYQIYKLLSYYQLYFSIDSFRKKSHVQPTSIKEKKMQLSYQYVENFTWYANYHFTVNNEIGISKTTVFFTKFGPKLSHFSWKLHLIFLQKTSISFTMICNYVTANNAEVVSKNVIFRNFSLTLFKYSFHFLQRMPSPFISYANYYSIIKKEQTFLLAIQTEE